MNALRRLGGPAAALWLLFGAVAFGAFFFGAPPRFGSVPSAGPFYSAFLESLAPYTVLQVAILAALAVLASAPSGGGVARARAPLALLILLGSVQLLVLPEWLLGIVAPYSAETYAGLVPPGDTTWRPMSLWPAGTVDALLNLAGMYAAFTATWLLVQRERRSGGDGTRVVERILLFVVIVMSLEALYGFYETWLADDGYLGLSKVSGKGRVTGTFIHGTMAALWAGMGACAALGLGARRWVQGRHGIAVVYAGACVLGLAAAQFSLSRMGFLAAGIAFAAALWFIGSAMRRNGVRLVGWTLQGASILAPVAGVVLALTVPRFRARLDYALLWLQGIDVPEEPRLAMWGTTLDLFAEAPVLGTGLGSFGRSVHLTQWDSVPQELWFAHSDPLNLLADVGIVGFTLVVWWIAATLWRGRAAVRGGDAGVSVLAAGAMGAATVVLIAAFGDFQTQFPVVSIPFAALFAVPAALAARTEEEGPLPRPWAARAAAVAIGLLAVTPLIALGERWSHCSAGYAPGATAAERLVARAKHRVQEREDIEIAREEFLAASIQDPLLDEAHLWYGIALQKTGGEPDDVLRALGRARRVSRGHVDVNLLIGRIYLVLLHPLTSAHGPPNDSAIAALREAGALSPKAFSVGWELSLKMGLDIEDLRALVPARAHALLTWSRYLRKQGDTAGELAALEEAVAVEPRHVVARLLLMRRLLDDGEVAAADEHLREVLFLEPENPGFHAEAAAAYRATDHEAEGRAVFGAEGVAWPAD